MIRVLLGNRVLTHPLPETGDVLLGRESGVNLVINHPSVSRQHARLRLEPGGLLVTDLGSANGTRVAGKPLSRDVPAPVRPSDAIEIGDIVLVIQRGHAPHAGPQAPRLPCLGQSPAMREVAQLVDRIARGTISALVVGETGAGKEVVAEVIHRSSPRSRRPFLRLNCAAVAASLLESEWFGYERGAFSGATTSKPGLLETADGGTVLLDEVGEMPWDIQAKLLRVIEERAILRVGGLRTRRIDVRFIAATNRDLEAACAGGTFRRDLYFRLNGVTISVPPLRERREEITPLASAFIAEMSHAAGRSAVPVLEPDAQAWLEAYSWPGNVRELRNVVERAVLLVDESRHSITTAELPKGLRPGATADVELRETDEPNSSPAESLKDAVAGLEKQRVLLALAEAGGNQKRAAGILGISRGTLLARLDAFGITRPRKV